MDIQAEGTGLCWPSVLFANKSGSIMQALFPKLSFQEFSLLLIEDGQDLVEYALVVALLAFGVITAMKGLSSNINLAFSNIKTTLSTNIT